jgi:hypothetical protein
MKAKRALDEQEFIFCFFINILSLFSASPAASAQPETGKD